MSLLLSDFYPRVDAVLVSGNQSISGIKTFNERIIVPEIRGSGIAGINRKIDLQLGQLFAGTTTASLDYWARILSGNWQFQNRPTVSGSGVLLQGEAAAAILTDVVFTTGTQTITGPKNFSARPTFNNSNLITTGDLVNLELSILGLENFVRTTGNQTISGIKNFSSRPTVMGTGVLLQGEIVQSVQDPFNGNRNIKRIPSLSDPQPYGGTTISGFLENMFFPFISGTVSLNEFTTRIYGVNTINTSQFPGGSYSSNDNGITGIAYINNTQILAGPTSLNVPLNTNANYSATTPIALNASLTASSAAIYRTRLYVTGANGTGMIESSARRIRFEPPYFWGVSTNTGLGAAVSSLQRVDPISNPNFYTYAFEGKPSSIRHQFYPTGQYVYIAYPAPLNTQENINSWGTVTSIIEDQTKFPYISQFTEQAPVDINLGTKTLRYRIWRSNNVFNPQPGQFFDFIFTLT